MLLLQLSVDSCCCFFLRGERRKEEDFLPLWVERKVLSLAERLVRFREFNLIHFEVELEEGRREGGENGGNAEE